MTYDGLYLLNVHKIVYENKNIFKFRSTRLKNLFIEILFN